ncbi:8-oxoguanine DNA glycosylase OGG fold protein [Micromonospora sp. IBSANI012]|uniref:8-oxoguanine DNA glycosylase OGG fold protein n=1 Tax=Micromonospora sp. IBSANI012 TaxID=3457761 RepID=UPI004058797D
MTAHPNDPAGEQPCDWRKLLPSDASDYDRGVVEGGLTAEEQDLLRRQRREWEARCGGGPLSPEELVDSHTIHVVPSRWARFAEYMPSGAGSHACLPLSRGTVTDAARGCRRENETWLPLLVTSFAWGWGKRGFGPARLAWILNGRGPLPGHSPGEIENRLAAAVQVLDDQGGRAAYQLLLKGRPIPGFGPAFFTKFLYFASRTENERCLALILDKRLARQMRCFWERRAGEAYAVNGPAARWLWRGPRWSPRRYQVYLAFMCRGAAQLSESGERWTPELVELLLFRGEPGDGPGGQQCRVPD